MSDNHSRMRPSTFVGLIIFALGFLAFFLAITGQHQYADADGAAQKICAEISPKTIDINGDGKPVQITLSGADSIDTFAGMTITSWTWVQNPADYASDPSLRITDLPKVPSTTPTVTFHTPAITANTTFRVDLTVSDGSNSSVVHGYINIYLTGTPPTANISASVNGTPGTTATGGDVVMLDGSGSLCTGSCTYAWSQDTSDTTRVQLSSSAGSTVTFSAPDGVVESLHFTLTITDGIGYGQADTIVSIKDPPVAVAAATPTSANVGDAVTLDGTLSSDSTGTIDSYAWSVTTGYAGVNFSDNNDATAGKVTFTAPPLNGVIGDSATLSFQLVVSDGTDSAQTTTDNNTGNNLQVTVNKLTPPPIDVMGYNVLYDGDPHTATCPATVVNGVDLCTYVDLTNTMHTNAGNYSDTWTFHDPTGTYTDASGPVNDNIARRDATWTTNPNSKTYGNPDPSPLTTGSGNFLPADNVTATYTRAAGETVLGGPYLITATLAPAAVLTNYNITNTGANFTIQARDATWTTNPNSKTYGNPDPSPLTTGSGNFLPADNVTATYTRAAGETVLGGPYLITATLAPAAVLTNYNITNTGANFTIQTRDATWTTNPNSKTYGNPDPSPLTTGSGNFLPADNVTATYTRAAGETVLGGPYLITATLAPAAVLTNYNITNTGANFTIQARDATWTTNPNSKTYGNPDPSPLTTGSGNFLPADNVTATYTRAAGETVLGGPYLITATLAPAAVLTNYNITNTGANFTIQARDATWTTNPNSKTYGNPDPSPLTTGSGNFLPADNVTATYTRAAGETVLGGPYLITATLVPAAVLTNYNITNTGANFTIQARDATWTTNPNSKTYGNPDPSPLTTGSGNFLPADNVTATYTRAAGETVLGGPYTISTTLSPAGVLGNYNITYNTATFTINQANVSVAPNPASKTYGASDPNPLTTGTLTGFLPSDNVTATYSRTPGETVAGGPYTISATLSPAGVLGNYNITYNTATFTINQANASVTPNPAGKTYGQSRSEPADNRDADRIPGLGQRDRDLQPNTGRDGRRRPLHHQRHPQPGRRAGKL